MTHSDLAETINAAFDARDTINAQTKGPVRDAVVAALALLDGGPGGANWWDKVPSKFVGWNENRFREAGFRAVPGAIVRHSAYVARNVVLMPSFVNLGAYVDEG